MPLDFDFMLFIRLKLISLLLQDFQHYEEGKDQGINVREKAKQLEALLKDDERLKNERVKALKARERFAQQTTGFGIGSDSNVISLFLFSKLYLERALARGYE